MEKDSVFRTRVGGRVLGLFFVCALLPVGLLARLSYQAVTSQLVDQAEERVRERAVVASQLVLQRLAAVGQWAQVVDFDRMGGDRFALPPGARGLGVGDADSVARRLGDFPAADPDLTAAESGALARLGTVLFTSDSESGREGFLVVDPGGGSDRAVWVALNLDSLWAPVMTLSADANVDDLCFVDSDGTVLACARGPESEIGSAFTQIDPAGESQGLFSVPIGDDAALTAWREVFLRSSYGVDSWYVLTSERRSTIVSPVSNFTRSLLASLGLAFALVLLLTHAVVRRTMRPLAELIDGAEGLAARELDTRVTVQSDDEFGQLAKAFNSMAASIEVQFHELEASHGIDQAVVVGRDRAGALEALVDGVSRLVTVNSVAVLLFDIDHEGSDALCYRPEGRADLHVELLPGNDGVPEWVPREADWLPASEGLTRALAPAGMGGGQDHAYAIPMRLEAEVVGVVLLGIPPLQGIDGAAAIRVDKLVARAAVALNEVRLRNELREMSRDSLTVLANAIDAKSRWTAGHSQRVTALAEAIGRKLGVHGPEAEILRRGGLLHDVGKIGVPREVLDFPGRLSDDQFAIIKGHPRIGVTILEPMKVFRPILPIVLHHHERWDGKGYPDGLKGKRIPRLARILAVADVFDAMSTPRPYRDALTKEFVVSHIEEGAGTQFDPEVVQGFLRVMSAGWVHSKVVPGAPLADVVMGDV